MLNVYIYVRQLSSFRAPTLWFIDLTVATCHIQYTFLSLSIFFTRKRTKHENTRSPPFSYDTKMAADGYWARKALMLSSFDDMTLRVLSKWDRQGITFNTQTLLSFFRRCDRVRKNKNKNKNI